MTAKELAEMLSGREVGGEITPGETQDARTLGCWWSYETDIPHETFNIYEDGEVWCVGIVFSVEDLT